LDSCCQHFPKRLQAAAKGQGNHNEAECDEPLGKFYKKKATPRKGEKRKEGARTESPVQAKQNSPTKASQNVASQTPAHTHTHTHTHIHTNIENTEIMISDTSETCRWDHNNNNHCLKSILHFVSLFELQTKIGSDFWVV